MNRSRIATLIAIAIALVSALPVVAHASSDIPDRGTLPDNRGYELVSPSDKNGGDVMADAARTRASDAGDAVGFVSLTAFGDALGTGVATEYVSQRTGASGTRGWQAHGITPRVDPLASNAAFQGKDTIFRGEFSSDLTRGVLSSFSSVTDDSDVANVTHLYLRTDLRSPGFGGYTLLSSCPACDSPLDDPRGSFNAAFADATPDLSHVIFEANEALTADSPPEPAGCLLFSSCTPNVYEWDHGTLRLASILPDGSPAPLAIAGGKASSGAYTLNTMSDDGSRIFFTVPSSAYGVAGDLYMRVDHATTVKLNASVRTDCADHDPCSGVLEPDPAGPQEARFQIASDDGSKIFFSTSEQLTDAPGGELYVYDTTLPTSDPDRLRHVFTDQQPSDGQATTNGVVAVSRDGSYFYFLAQGAILPDQQPLAVPTGIYVWHNGVVDLVGATANPIGTVAINPPGYSARIAADGRTLFFTALDGSGLTGYDHGETCFAVALSGDGPCSELYRYRADTTSLSCVSCNPTGAPGTADATSSIRVGTGGAGSSSHLNSALSEDGNHVFFETGERLLPYQDVNGKKRDVYEWTAEGADSCMSSTPGFVAASDGCLSLITPGTSTDDSHFLDASPSGQDVFFSTNQRLVGWDTDNNYDLYDARVGGGLPDPVPAKAECSGEGCQGSIAIPSVADALQSTTSSEGTGNVSGNVRKPAAKKPVAEPSSKTQRLKKALKACKKKRRGAPRDRCERLARKRSVASSMTKRSK